MAANATSAEATIRSTPAHEQASGTSIFWALASLALNTMIQPSSSGHALSGNALGGAFWPHRSSPVICLADACVDVWVTVDSRRRPEQYTRKHQFGPIATATPTAVMARLVLFIVSVLPQAIKLFSMRGIPVSQAVGAIYVVAAVTSTVRIFVVQHTALSNRADNDSDAIVTEHETVPETPESEPDVARIAFLTLQAGFLYAIWSRIGVVIDLHASENLVDAAAWFGALSSMLILVHLAQHTISMLLRGQWTLPRLPALVMLGLMATQNFPDLLLTPPEDRVLRHAQMILTIHFAVNAGLCCFVFAWILIAGAEALNTAAKWLVSRSAHSTDALPAYGTDSTGAEEGSGTTSEVEVENTGSPGTDPSFTAANAAENSKYEPRRTLQALSSTEPAVRARIRRLTAFPSAVNSSATTEEGQQQRAPPGMFYGIIITMLLRLGLSFVSIIIYPYNWTLHHLQRGRNPEVLWLAVGIMHAVTAATYYGVVFDGAGTKAPEWTGVLG